MAERTGWAICRDNGWWSTFGKRGRGKHKKAGPAVHDDLVQRIFTATAPNQVWLTDVTEHWTGEGKVYLCAIKDLYSNRIVGYSIDSRMKSRLAVNALNNAVARRGDLTRATGVCQSRVMSRASRMAWAGLVMGSRAMWSWPAMRTVIC
ncbi:hypothetical protein Lsed01_01494 [Demequina sediminis]|uniref:Integrase catalytic domain-containing protein n=1 Tax=Demequina sediminis TaxID=1930058 RepID=A0ABP9WIZ5_9MICO|nr:DDE-type integrase/transposase/recombinase [Demequina sediminis]